MNNTYTQAELLKFLQTYNSLDRMQIKQNLKEIKRQHNFQNIDIVTRLNENENKIKGWFSKASPNLPSFEDLLRLSIEFEFDLEEVVK